MVTVFLFGLLVWIAYLVIIPESDPGFPVEPGAWDYDDDSTT